MKSLDRNLIDYLPPVLKEVREFKLIFQSEQPEIADLWGSIDNALNDQFVIDATEYGVGRWEKILGIVPKVTESLDSRKFRILTRLNERLPHTVRVLEQQLETLCGKDGYIMDLNENKYRLEIRIELSKKRVLEEITSFVKRIIPANLILIVDLEYNKHCTFSGHTYEFLKRYTHEQLKYYKHNSFSGYKYSSLGNYTHNQLRSEVFN